MRSSNSLKPEAIAGWCLLNKPSFRFPSSASSDRLIGFRSWIRVSRKLLTVIKNSTEKHEDGIHGFAVFDNFRSVKDIRLNHIRSNAAEVPTCLFFREELSNASEKKRFSEALLLFFLMPILSIWCFFSSRRINIALLYDELAEATQLLRLLKIANIKTLYFFSPFEKDANALYLLLKNEEVNITKIPSPNLLSIHHKQVLTDTLVLSSPYQQDELEFLQGSIHTKNIQHWLPEQFFSYRNVYGNCTVPDFKTIGYYSHASWLRQQEDHALLGAGDLESEIELLQVLFLFLKKHSDFNLTIFLHPREKKHVDFSQVEKYYQKHFNGLNFVFSDYEKSSALLFNTVDIGIGAISTILFERLFVGFKTIFYPSRMKVFPVDRSVICKICALDGESLEKIILNASSLETGSYFNQTGLLKYTSQQWIKSEKQ